MYDRQCAQHLTLLMQEALPTKFDKLSLGTVHDSDEQKRATAGRQHIKSNTRVVRGCWLGWHSRR